MKLTHGNICMTEVLYIKYNQHLLEDSEDTYRSYLSSWVKRYLKWSKLHQNQEGYTKFNVGLPYQVSTAFVPYTGYCHLHGLDVNNGCFTISFWNRTKNIFSWNWSYSPVEDILMWNGVPLTFIVWKQEAASWTSTPGFNS